MNMKPDNDISPVLRRPLYRQVAEQIRKMLHHYSPGDRLETEAVLLRRLGVSILTLRRSMEELEREGLIEKRQGSGTFYRGGAALQRRHVAVLLDVDETSPNLSPYFPKLTREIRKALNQLGIASRPYQGDLQLGTEATGLTSQDLLDDVRLERISGLISFFTHREEGWVSLLRKHHIPVIDPEFTHALFPERRFLPWAMDLLVRHGRRRVAAITWESPTDQRRPFSRQLQTLSAQYNLPIDQAWLDVSADGWEQGMGWERFRDIWTNAPEKPDALIIDDDTIFSDVQQAILEMGINVPEDLLVLVQTSDAYPLDPRIPVGLEIIDTQQTAMIYAEIMKSLLNGETPSPPAPLPGRIEFIGMDAEPATTEAHSA